MSPEQVWTKGGLGYAVDDTVPSRGDGLLIDCCVFNNLLVLKCGQVIQFLEQHFWASLALAMKVHVSAKSSLEVPHV